MQLIPQLLYQCGQEHDMGLPWNRDGENAKCNTYVPWSAPKLASKARPGLCTVRTSTSVFHMSLKDWIMVEQPLECSIEWMGHSIEFIQCEPFSRIFLQWNIYNIITLPTWCVYMCMKACVDVCAYVCVCMLCSCECRCMHGVCVCTCVFLYGGSCIFGLLCACRRRPEVNLRVASLALPVLFLRQVSQWVLDSLISLGWLTSEHKSSFHLCSGIASACCHVEFFTWVRGTKCGSPWEHSKCLTVGAVSPDSTGSPRTLWNQWFVVFW